MDLALLSHHDWGYLGDRYIITIVIEKQQKLVSEVRIQPL